MSSNMMKFSYVESRTASPKTLRELIKSVLKADDDACAQEILPFLTPPGQNGSREYDHCEAVTILLRYDALDKNGGHIGDAMKAQNISKRMLWDHVVAVYRGVGFRFKQGRLIGLMLEEDDQPNNGPEDSIE